MELIKQTSDSLEERMDHLMNLETALKLFSRILNESEKLAPFREQDNRGLVVGIGDLLERFSALEDDLKGDARASTDGNDTPEKVLLNELRKDLLFYYDRFVSVFGGTPKSLDQIAPLVLSCLEQWLRSHRSDYCR